MSYFVIKKRHLLLVFTAMLLLIAFIILTAGGKSAVSDVTEASSANKLLPIYSVETDKKRIAFSFDAAWGNEDTKTLIDILAKYNVKTTFFVVGQWVDKYPESVKQLSDAGHEVQNHSNTHPDFTNLSRDAVTEQIQSCNEKVKSVTGKSPVLLRAPYGAYNNTAIETINLLGMYPIQWDVDSLDWKGISADTIYDRVTKKVRNGSIILFHNAAKHTPEALPGIIEKLQSDGYEIVKVSELIMRDNYTIDHTGRQQTNANTSSSTSSK